LGHPYFLLNKKTTKFGIPCEKGQCFKRCWIGEEGGHSKCQVSQKLISWVVEIKSSELVGVSLNKNVISDGCKTLEQIYSQKLIFWWHNGEARVLSCDLHDCLSIWQIFCHSRPVSLCIYFFFLINLYFWKGVLGILFHCECLC